ncbi:MAG: cobalamin-binding protein [Candidatus Obscuribacter phosphatis]|uniref:Cobalamin-binding protein n=1 Tax=Candidatus Obscuribacter phosphatis TaxID=1906157 RepID=A0A8J7TKG6_9BACT|nr:cobalamin-binding protein [Candidatus Obscuribacter phosphatis]
MAQKDLRIVSLIASSTELVHALGLGHFMVGRSHECDFPKSVKELPVCTAPKFNVDGSSKEIDDRVKEILAKSLSVYLVDAERLDELAPSHIITQAQCEVCAVSLRDVEEAACALIASRPQIIALEPNCLEDYFSDLRRVAVALNAVSEGEALEKAARKRIDAVRELTERALPQDSKPTVAVIEWIEPLMAAGNWMPELVEMAGGINLFGESGKHSPWMSFDDLVARDADIILVTPCGFDNKKTLEEMPVLLNNPRFQKLRAVQTGRLYVADGNQYFNRPGPRLVDSLEMLAEIFHPHLFAGGSGFKYKDAWLKL